MEAGCTDTLVHAGAWRRSPRTVHMTAVNDGALRCMDFAQVTVSHRENQAQLMALGMPSRPLGMGVVLGLSGIAA